MVWLKGRVAPLYQSPLFPEPPFPGSDQSFPFETDISFDLHNPSIRNLMEPINLYWAAEIIPISEKICFISF